MDQRRKDMGNKIREARKQAGMAQKDLAAAVHVETMTVSRWERGAHAPSLDMLETIAAVTGRPLSYFLDQPQRKGVPPPTVDPVTLQTELAELVYRLEELADRLDARLADPKPQRGSRRSA